MNPLARSFSALLLVALPLSAQVYSPTILKAGQADTADLTSLAASIYRNAHAVSEREKAEAIWRFYLTDGRFVKPGIFYHIPGWAYEEPMGEVLDPIKLLNSYGFGLCYQDGPLLQATWDAGGFRHTRVWFLTGHTVAEVFYDGQYHYYDSDMMGYTTVGDGPVNVSPIASVQQIEKDPRILLSKLESPKSTRPSAVANPWYPADVREAAIGDLAGLFSSSTDNYVYGYTRYPSGHAMNFELRPGERMVRFYRQPNARDRYLPYKNDGAAWSEFPKDVGSILLVDNGPRSEKDERRWSTGFLEYHPSQNSRKLAEINPTQAVYSVNSPYVIIDAEFALTATLQAAQSVDVETSTDQGHTWQKAGTYASPVAAPWTVSPLILSRSPHGSRNAVAGTYGYLVRLTLHGGASLEQAIGDLRLHTNFELNPRTLPALTAGENELTYRTSSTLRLELPIQIPGAQQFATDFQHAELVTEQGQSRVQANPNQTGVMIFPISAPGATTLSGIDVGGRFLDLRDGLAPDKLTAEVRHVTPWPKQSDGPGEASIAWSTGRNGPWNTVWTYDPHIVWPDHGDTPRILRWPEVDRSIRNLPSGTRTLFVRYTFRDLAVDDLRLATVQTAPQSRKVAITHSWIEDGEPRRYSVELEGSDPRSYRISIPLGAKVEDLSIEVASPNL